MTAPRKAAGSVGSVLADVAKLKRPVTAAAAAATIAAAVSPLGLNVGPDGAIIVGALTLVGVIAGILEKALKP